MAKIFTSLVLIAILSIATAIDYPNKTDITGKLPNYPFSGDMYTGYIVVDEASQANLFYHLYAINQGKTTDAGPLIIWLQGGPGCSSMAGDFMEMGPVLINAASSNTCGSDCNLEDNFQVIRNDYTWNNVAHMLFIDQPTGTGFSISNGFNVSTV